MGRSTHQLLEGRALARAVRLALEGGHVVDRVPQVQDGHVRVEVSPERGELRAGVLLALLVVGAPDLGLEDDGRFGRYALEAEVGVELLLLHHGDGTARRDGAAATATTQLTSKMRSLTIAPGLTPHHMSSTAT